MDLNDWLKKTLAGDIMIKKVVSVSPAAPLAQAAAKLLHERISGMPVVDIAGVCVGVLSASDIVGADEKVAEQRKEVAQSSFWSSGLALPVAIYQQKLEEVRDKIAPAAEQPVEHFMTKDIVSVGPDTPLGTIVQHMIDAQIHRVFVMDEKKNLMGVVSTTDVLAALLRAARKGGKV